MADANRWKATVYVGNLAAPVTSAHVLDAFLPFGEIVEVQLPKADASGSTSGSGADPHSQQQQQHKGFAYVEFEDAADAREAIDNMDQSELFGRAIRVSAARVPKSAEEGLGSKKAVWEQEKWLAENAGEEGMGAEELAQDAPDPMQGLEGLDVAGPKPE